MSRPSISIPLVFRTSREIGFARRSASSSGSGITLTRPSSSLSRNRRGFEYSALKELDSAGASASWRKVQLRGIHQSAPHSRFWESSPRGEYRDPNFEKDFQKKMRQNLWGLTDGLRDLREGVSLWTEEIKESFGDDSHLWKVPGDKDLVWKFDNKKVLENWTTLSDSDHNEGFSKCELTMSPTGKAIFQGYVNTQAPKDGRVKTAGYCFMKSKRPMKSFGRKSYLDWEPYTHLLMRVRGDGRSYVINISTAGFYDITWNDVFHYVLYTRGGPYWQYVKIPFSKFVFGSKGRVQDMVMRIPLDRVSSVGLAAAKIDGPFCLEVDYIGLEYEPSYTEQHAYENYRIPKFIANV